MKKEFNKMLKKTNKLLLLFVFLFLALGIGAGYLSSFLLTKNDTFELIGEKSISLSLNEKYQDTGVKVISYGLNLNDKVSVDSNLDTSKEGEYRIIYTVKSLKYKNVKRVRYITVGNGSGNNG